jgi:hypothetical protein
MSVIYNENKTHRDAIAAAEGVRQVALAAATTQSAVRTADLAYARSCLKSAIQNNIPDASNWTMLLASLGVQT